MRPMMTNKHPDSIPAKLLCYLLLLSFIALPTQVQAQDNTPSVRFRTFGQSAGEALSFENVQLDSIAINNTKATIMGTDLSVYKDDAVRIEGRANPGSRVTVIFGDKEIQATADYGGSWFVLFSITNMIEGKYAVNAKADNSDKTILLVNLIVGQGNRILEPSVEPETVKQPNSDRSPYIYAATGLIALVLGWFSRIFYEKISSKRRSIKKR